jgi:hypothetical protein
LVVRYDDLVSEPLATVERIYGWLGEPVGDAFRLRLEEALHAHRSYRSEHEYSLEEFGLTREEIYAELKPVFDEFGFSRHDPVARVA